MPSAENRVIFSKPKTKPMCMVIDIIFGFISANINFVQSWMAKNLLCLQPSYHSRENWLSFNWHIYFTALNQLKINSSKAIFLFLGIN